MSNQSVLDRFIQDISCLEPVAKTVSKVNIFKVLEVSRTEIRHSNMLAWLMDPHGNHGLGDRVLRGIIGLVDDDPPSDFSGFTIHRESNHIDLLAVSEKEKYVFCIENKTYSSEHDDQLGRYKRYLDTTFMGYRLTLVYLTRKGTLSSDPDTWLAMGYGDVLKVIGEARSAVELQPAVGLIIDHYLEVVRELNGGDDTVRKLCAEVYRKHQAAIDLIFGCMNGSGKPAEREICGEIYRAYKTELDQIWKYRPGKGPDPIADYIRQWANLRTDEGWIEICQAKTTDAVARFRTKAMSELLPDVAGVLSGWKTENFYFYELRNRKLRDHEDEHEVFLELCTNSENIPDDLRRMSDRINAVSAMSSQDENWLHRINFATDRVIFNDSADKDAVWDQLDKFLEQMLEYERELTARLGM